MHRSIHALVLLSATTVACTDGANALQSRRSISVEDGAVSAAESDASAFPDTGPVPPLCTDAIAVGIDPSSGGPGASGWAVHATGEVTYDAGPFTARSELAVVLPAVLASVDLDARAITLSTATGSTVVTLEPVQPSWLDALPLGASVVAHFEHGLVLRDASDDSLLLAVAVNVSGTPPDFTIDPIRMTSAGVRCVQAQPASNCNAGLYIIHSQLDVSFALGATTVTGVPNGVVRLADASNAFEVVLIGSVIEGGATAANLEDCEPGLPGGTFVAMGRVTP